MHNALLRFVASVTEQELGLDWATAVEVCTQTLVQEGVARVHFHLLLRHHDSAVWLPGPQAMVFEGVRPHVAAAPILHGSKVTSARTWAGYFYCSVSKIGQVFVDANRVAFRDYPVQGQWVMSLFQAGKIAASTARALVYKVAHGVTRLLADLDAVERWQEEERVEAARVEALAYLATRRCKFRSLPLVEAWDTQFQEVKDRYLFLVLDGPSRMGKTAYGRSKCPKGQEVLELNCAAGGDPDLRSYRYGRHGLILCDEIEAKVVAAQRKLFQAGTAPVQLGTSATNIHAYTVFLHRVRIICASNNWAASADLLAPADREWIEANSIYVRCDEQLWEQS